MCDAMLSGMSYIMSSHALCEFISPIIHSTLKTSAVQLMIYLFMSMLSGHMSKYHEYFLFAPVLSARLNIKRIQTEV